MKGLQCLISRGLSAVDQSTDSCNGRSGVPRDPCMVVSGLASAEEDVGDFSSSTGRHSSFRDPAWGNRAVGSSLIEGFNAETVRAKTRSPHEMKNYRISDFVQQISQGKQPLGEGHIGWRARLSGSHGAVMKRVPVLSEGVLNALLSIVLLTLAAASVAMAKDTRQPTLQIQVGHGHASAVAFSASPTGDLVASADQHIVKVWEAKGGRLICTLDPGKSGPGFDRGGRAKLAWSADGTQLLSPDHSGGYFLWDLRNCGNRNRLNIKGQLADAPIAESRERPPVVQALLTLPNDEVLASTSLGVLVLSPFRKASLAAAGTPAMWSVALAGSVTATALTKGERFVAGQSRDGRVLLLARQGLRPFSLLDRETGIETPLSDFKDHDEPAEGGDASATPQAQARAVALSASGRWLAVKSAKDTSIRIYDVQSRALKAAVQLTVSAEKVQALTQNFGTYANLEVLRAEVAGLDFSTDERSVYIYRDGGLVAPIGRPTLEIRATESLALLKDLPQTLIRPRPVQPFRIMVTSQQTGDQIIVPLRGDLGVGLLSIVTRSNIAVGDLWEMDGIGRVLNLAFGTQGWFSHGEGRGSARFEDQVLSPRPANPTPAQVQEILRHRNRVFQTHVNAWSSEKASVSRDIQSDNAFYGLTPGAFSPGGRFHAVETRVVPIGTQTPATLALWDTASSSKVWTVVLAPTPAGSMSLAVSSEGRLVAAWHHSGAKDELKIYDGRTGALVSSTRFDFGDVATRVVFSEDATKLHFTGFRFTGTVDVAKAEQPRLVWSKGNVCCKPLGFLPKSGRLVMVPLPDHVLGERSSYEEQLFGGWVGALNLPIPDAAGLAVANPSETLVAVAQNRVIRLVDIRGQPIVSGQLTGLTSSVTAMSFSPDGKRLLAGDDEGGLWLWDIAGAKLLARMYAFADSSWVVIDAAGRFDTNDVEAMRRLHWLLPDEPFRAYPLELFMRDFFEPQLLPRLLAGLPLAPVPAVSAINRAQPLVQIVDVKPSPAGGDLVDVTLTVHTTNGSTGQNSGAADLRLFRNGQLVAGSDLKQPAHVQQLAAGANVLVKFAAVRLPGGSKPIEFSAYAFNVDRVKSATAVYAFNRPSSTTTPRRRAFVISMGVNVHDRPEWDLTFAANDARKTQEVLSLRLQASRLYDDVVTLQIVSDERSSDAKKGVLKAALLALSGRPFDQALLSGLSGWDKLSAATPDDVVIVSFAGHGFASGGEFYLVPQDIGGGKRIDDATRQRAVSTAELADWLSGIDAGELTMVIDACQSAAAVESDGFKPGPMGAKGLGQLAYDKGMRILAATQSDDVALESGSLRHGLLTFALIQEGLNMGKADFRPVDRKVDMVEWLTFGSQRVPQIYSDVRAGRRAMNDGKSSWQFEMRGATAVPMPGASAAGMVRIQRPSLFDFKRAAASSTLSTLD